MKRNKIICAVVVVFIMITMLTISSSAASSFTPNKNNFIPVFDFDTVPATYKVGDKPGTRNDTVGLSKDQKAVEAASIGLTYTLTIENNTGYSKNALRLDVTDMAPENGAWCPVGFHTVNGKNLNENVVGATDFAMWVDTTGFKQKSDGKTVEKSILFYVQEDNIDKNGKKLDTASAWGLKKKKDGGHILFENGKGGWDKKETNEEGHMILPENYKGWIKVPVANFAALEWSKDAMPKFHGNYINFVSFGMGNYGVHSGSKIIFDEIGFIGNYKKVGSDTTKTDKPVITTKNEQTSGSKSEKPQPDNNVTDKVDGTTTSEADGTMPSATNDTDITGYDDPSTNQTNTIGAKTTSDKDDDNKGFPWKTFIIIVVVILVVLGIVVGVLIYKKKQNENI